MKRTHPARLSEQDQLLSLERRTMPNKVAALFSFAILLLAASLASAAPVGFQVDKMAIETTANAGDTQTGVITITNVEQTAPGAAPDSLRLRVYAADWTLDRSGKPLFAQPGTASD